jgi:hypothetical protein
MVAAIANACRRRILCNWTRDALVCKHARARSAGFELDARVPSDVAAAFDRTGVLRCGVAVILAGKGPQHANMDYWNHCDSSNGSKWMGDFELRNGTVANLHLLKQSSGVFAVQIAGN